MVLSRTALAQAVVVLALAVVPVHGAEADKPRLDLFGDPLPDEARLRLGTLRFRIEGGGRATLSPDGKTIALVGRDGLTLLDAVSGKEVQRWAMKDFFGFGSAVFSPDGKRIAVTDTQRVQLFDAKTGLLLGSLTSVPNPGLPVFSADGTRFALGSTIPGNKLKVTLWAVDGFKKLHEFEALQDLHVSVALSADGKRLATWGQSRGGDEEGNNTVQVWEAATGKELKKIVVEGMFYVRGGVTLSPDGKELAAANPLGVGIYEVDSGKLLHQLAARRNLGPLLSYSSDGKLLVAGARNDGTLHLWETPEYKRLGATVGPTYANSIAFLPDKKVRVLGWTQRGLEVWEAPSGRRLAPRDVHTGTVTTLCFSADSQKLLSGSYDGVRFWDAATGKHERLAELRDPDYAILGHSYFLVAPGARSVLAASTLPGYGSRMLDLATEQEVFGVDAAFDQSTGLTAAFSADGATLAVVHPHFIKTGGRTFDVRLWDLIGAREKIVLKLETSDRVAVAVSPDGKAVLAAVNSKPLVPKIGPSVELVLWDTATGKELWRVTREKQWATQLAFSPDGETIATTGIAGTAGVYLLSAATGRELRSVEVADGLQIACLLFSPDGRTLVGGGTQRTGMDVTFPVRLWETTTGKPRVEFIGHRAAVTALAFARDGRTLASGSEDTTVLLWDLTGQRHTAVQTAGKPKESEFDGLWQNLADANGENAYRLIQRLATYPTAATLLMKAKLAPAKGPKFDAPEIDKRIADLDEEDFERREQASKALADLGLAARPALEKALQRQPSTEMKRRLQALLKAMELNPERVRLPRALEVLEQINTPEAKQLLEELAKGAPEAPLTREAKATLKRLATRE